MTVGELLAQLTELDPDRAVLVHLETAPRTGTTHQLVVADGGTEGLGPVYLDAHPVAADDDREILS